MGLSDLVGGAVGALGTAALKRTYLLEKNTPTGIPRLLIVFDAVTNEVVTYESTVTEIPVEEGPEVTDHIQKKNPKISLSGTISQTPLDLSVGIGNLIGGGIAAFTSSQARSNLLNSGVQQAAGVAGAALLGGAGLPSLTGGLLGGLADAIARTALLDAYERRARFSVITRRFQYDDMVIQKMTLPRDNTTGNQMTFNIDFKQVRIVSALTVQIDTVGEDVVTSALDSSNLGNQSGSALNATASGAANRSTFAVIDDLTGRAISGT